MSANLISNQRVSQSVESEFRAHQTFAEMRAEGKGINEEMPQLDAAIANASQVRDALIRSYDGGRVIAPADAIIGALPVRQGSVARTGDTLMELYTGKPYVLSYIPEGAMFEMKVGDPVDITVGLKTYSGHVARIFPVSSQLPNYFRDEIRPPSRAQVMHITFDAGQTPPTLFSKPKVTSPNWLPNRLIRAVLG